MAVEVLMTIYSAVDWMSTAIENTVANGERCRRLFERANMIKQLLQQNFGPSHRTSGSGPLTLALTRTSETIAAAVQLVSNFTGEPATGGSSSGRGESKSFFQRASNSLRQLTKIIYNKDWEGEFSDLSVQLSTRLGDLNLVLQVKAQVDFSQWARENEVDRERDARALRASLQALEASSKALSHQMTDLQRDAADKHQLLAGISDQNEETMLLQQQMRQQQASIQSQLVQIFQVLSARETASPSSSTSNNAPPPPPEPVERPAIDPRLTIPLYELEFGPLLTRTRTSTITLGVWRNHNVVIKSVAQAWTGAEARQQFFREVEITALLRSPYVVQLYAACIEDDRASLVLEYVPGGSLRERLARDGRPPFDAAVQLALGLIAGLSYLHELGFFHRDLRSSKVLLDELGRPKICDFSTAKDTHSRLEFAPDTLRAAAVPPVEECRWMAPEVIGELFGSAARPQFVEATAASDVYSLGVIFYELCSGVEPYASEPTALLLGLLNDGRSFLEKNALPPDCPDGMVSLIRQCTLPLPGARPHLTSLLAAVKAQRTAQLPNPFQAELLRDVCAVSAAHGSPCSPFRTIYLAAQAAAKSSDVANATALLQLVVQSGDMFYAPRAATDLAVLIRRNTNKSSADVHAAARLLEYAAQFGYPRALKMLVVQLLDGCPDLNIGADPKRAAVWVKLAESAKSADYPLLKARLDQALS